MHPDNDPIAAAQRAAWREACAKCGYDTTPTPAGNPCPECGALERTLPDERPLINRAVVRDVLMVQGIGGLCCLGASVVLLVSSESGLVTVLVLTTIGAVICLLVAPLQAMAWLYPRSRLADRPPAQGREWVTLLFLLASGAAAVVTGAMIATAGCAVGWVGMSI